MGWLGWRGRGGAAGAAGRQVWGGVGVGLGLGGGRSTRDAKTVAGAELAAILVLLI